MQTSKERKLFGTDGVRGIANQHPMTCEVALALGRAIAYQALRGPHRHRIVIGKDTRLSGYMLEMALASGICSMGVDVLLAGPVPTPAVAFLTHNMRADAGVMISASHNPYQDNGIKIFARDGFKLPDDKELELEHFLEDERIGKIRPTKSSIGKAYRLDDALGRYIVFLKNILPQNFDLSDLKIVIDCAHGAAYKVAPTILKELGATIYPLGVHPDGRNINKNCGAIYPAKLAEMVKRYQANLGLALDGDADRLIVVDEQGEIVDGDALLFLNAEHLLKHQQLPHETIVTTMMSNLALDHALKALGGKVVRTQVGDRYVVEEMKKNGYSFGGEQSGHLIYLNHATSGDGLLAALKLLTILKEQTLPLSNLSHRFKPYPQVLVNVNVTEKRDLASLNPVQKAIKQVERIFGEQGRVLVRFSGTELKARILVEGPELALVQQSADMLKHTLTQALNTGDRQAPNSTT